MVRMSFRILVSLQRSSKRIWEAPVVLFTREFPLHPSSSYSGRVADDQDILLWSWKGIEGSESFRSVINYSRSMGQGISRSPRDLV